MAEIPDDATFRAGDTVAVNAVVTRRGPGDRSEIELAHFSFDLSGGSRLVEPTGYGRQSKAAVQPESEVGRSRRLLVSAGSVRDGKAEGMVKSVESRPHGQWLTVQLEGADRDIEGPASAAIRLT